MTLKKLLIICAIILLPTCAFAQSAVIKMDLEAPALDLVQTKPVAKIAKPVAKTVKVGNVGQVKSIKAKIYKSRSVNGQVYSSVKMDTPLAIVKELPGWYGVVMANRAVGWIQSKDVKLTDYELVADPKDVRQAALTSRGGFSRGAVDETSNVIRTALSFTGTRYIFGGTSPSRGMDCSAFVRRVFSDYGVSLPRTAREQAQVGMEVSFDQLQPGDRLYFQCHNNYIDHCGIYAGNGLFVHCSSSRGGVAIDNLMSAFYSKSLVAARRSPGAG